LPNQTTYRFTYTTAIVYEIVKLRQASGKRARHAFLGEPGASESSDPPESLLQVNGLDWTREGGVLKTFPRRREAEPRSSLSVRGRSA
jgi:hypothetical protein